MKYLIDRISLNSIIILIVAAISIIVLSEREFKTILFISLLEASALLSASSLLKIRKMNEEPLRDGLIYLGAQICVGFSALGVYFLQF